MGLAQSSVEDSSLGSIESIGNDMINLLDDLSFGEVDPTQRLSMEPVFQNATNAVNNSPVFREAQAQKTYLLSVKNELDTAFNPTVTADGGVGRRTFSSNTSNGSTVRTTGNFIEQSITTSKMLFDFGATDAQKQAAQYNILAVDSKIESTKSELLLEAIIAFYEVQRNLLQSRLARENLQARKTFVNFIRERNTLGASSSADVVRAESRVAEALDLLSSALRSLSEAQARYRQYYNSEAEPYILPREINVEDLELFEVEKYALQNPSFIEAEYQIKVIMAQIDTLKAQKYGRVVVQGTLSNSRSPGQNNFNDDISVGLNFQTELYSGGVEESKLEQAQARLLQAELSRDSIRVGIIKELREKFATYEGELSAVDARLLVLDGSKETYSITKELYAFSRISLFEVLSSQEELFNSGRQLIDSIVDRAIAKYRLSHATQTLVEKVYDGRS
jgi:adhesin transport system outer membrane protein